MPIVWVPSLMRDLTGGEERVTAPGRTVGEVIEALERSFPGARARLCEGGRLAPQVAALVDGRRAPLGLLEPVREESEIRFVPAVSGG